MIFILWIFLPIALFTIAGTKIWWYIYPSVIGIIASSAILLSKITGSKISKATVITLITVITLCFFTYNVLSINTLRTNDFQQYIANLDTDFDGAEIYAAPDGTTQGFGQANFFIAECAGLNCREGNYNSFLSADSGSVFIVKTSLLKALKGYDPRFKKTHILREEDDFSVVRKE